MINLPPRDEIRIRIAEEKKILKNLGRQLRHEYDLPLMERMPNRFEFLYFEQKIHKARLVELRWMLQRKKRLIIVTWAGIGDVLLCTPTLRAVRKHYSGYKIIVYCFREDHLDILKYNPNIDSLRVLSIRQMWKYPYHLYAYLFDRSRIPYKELAFSHIPPNWYCRSSIKYIVPKIFNLELQPHEINTELFFSPEEEEKARRSLAPYHDVILMHIFSRSSPNHLWAEQKWAELVAQLPQYTFIQIGHSDEPEVKGAIDWRGKTSLREALCLVKHATSFLGVDSIHSHATNAFDIPGVVLFGDSDPAIFGHDNNINIYKGLSCSPCFNVMWGSRCPYSNECMKLIEVEEVKEAVIKQMNKARSLRYGNIQSTNADEA
jgi:ADP-heptose:LPS heptosyltransferase